MKVPTLLRWIQGHQNARDEKEPLRCYIHCESQVLDNKKTVEGRCIDEAFARNFLSSHLLYNHRSTSPATSSPHPHRGIRQRRQAAELENHPMSASFQRHFFLRQKRPDPHVPELVQVCPFVLIFSGPRNARNQRDSRRSKVVPP